MIQNSLRLAVLLAFAASASVIHAAPADPADPNLPRLKRILAATPLIDGHNDWAETLTEHAGGKAWTIDLRRLDTVKYDTDIERLRQGMLGGQFWSVYVPASLPGLEQVKVTLERIDLIRSIVARYPQDFTLATTAAQVRAAHKAGRIASMMGAEGGGQIDGSFSVLRAYSALGVGYLTLTHSRTIAWADSATDNPAHGGLTPFGHAVVREMNRLGMLVDLSHVSEAVMVDAIATSKAPVIFSHSGARAICNHPRNASDPVLRQVAANGGIVMVNFAPQYVSEARRVWGAARGAEQARYNAPPFGGLYIGEPDRAKAAMAEWEKANPEPKVTLSQVADHVDHIARIAGYDHVGLGGDYDGLVSLPEGMDGVESYPPLLLELMKRGWSDANIAKLAGGNILRVMEAAEKVAAGMAGSEWAAGTVAELDAASPGTKAASVSLPPEIKLDGAVERRRITGSSQTIITGNGFLINNGMKSMPLPPLRAVALDGAGQIVATLSVAVKADKAAAARIPFSLVAVDVPEQAVRVEIFFGDDVKQSALSARIDEKPAA